MWKVQREEVEECSLVELPIITLKTLPSWKILLLQRRFHHEWIAHLVGRKEGNEYTIDDLVIPFHQMANFASAEAEPSQQPENCIGIIHSHGTLGAFHSGTDDAYVDRNYPISITVSGIITLELDALVNLKTPCGRWMLEAVCVQVATGPLFDLDLFLRDAEAKICGGNYGKIESGTVRRTGAGERPKGR